MGKGNSNIFLVFYAFKDSTTELIEETFRGIEYHTLISSPFMDVLKVILDLVLSTVQQAVIRKRRQRVAECTLAGRSFMQRIKRSGPRTVPWGTPDITASSLDRALSISTDCVRRIRKDSIHARRLLQFA